MVWGAIAVGVISAAASMMGDEGEDANMERDARRFGMNEAHQRFAGRRNQLALDINRALTRDTMTLQMEGVEESQAMAEAEARVSAAQAGVAGKSVDAVVSNTAMTAARAKGELERADRIDQMQYEMSSTDVALNTEAAVGQFDSSINTKGRDKARLARGTLGFMQGYSMAI